MNPLKTLKTLKPTSLPVLAGAVIASASIAAFVIGMSTSSPGPTQGVPASYHTDTFDPNDKGGRTGPPAPPEDEPCIPVRIVPSQESDHGSQGTQLPVCPDAPGVALNIQTQVIVRLGDLSQDPTP